LRETRGRGSEGVRKKERGRSRQEKNRTSVCTSTKKIFLPAQTGEQDGRKNSLGKNYRGKDDVIFKKD